MFLPEPSKEEFIEHALKGTIAPLFIEINVPGLTPLTAFESLRVYGYPSLLESTNLDRDRGRYSFVAADPYLIFKSNGDNVEICLPSTPEGKYGHRARMKKNPLTKLRELMSNYRTGRLDELPPFTGGAIGFFSYDFTKNYKNVSHRSCVDFPGSNFLFFDAVVAFDHTQGRVWVIANPGAREQELGFRRPAPDQWSHLYDECVLRLTSMISTLKMPYETMVLGNVAKKAISIRTRLVPELSQTEFEAMTGRCRRHIDNGDVHHVNLSLRYAAASPKADSRNLYELLRARNPSYYATFLDFGDFQIVGSSSEHLVRLRNGIVSSRIATRLHTQYNHCKDEEKLLANCSEAIQRAHEEHRMLREVQKKEFETMCTGTVSHDTVLDQSRINTINIASDIHGRLEMQNDCFDLVRAFFPAGVVTGLPKARSMQIIDELEPVERGLYAGSVGYISNSGQMDLNIAVNTYIFKNNMVYFQMGTVVNAASAPEHLYIENLRNTELFNTVWENL